MIIETFWSVYRFISMKMKKKKIGVLGGMGPASTVLFYDALIGECRRQYGAMYDSDFPEIIIYNVPLQNIFRPDFPDSGAFETLLHAAQGLQSLNADFLVMPCNTAHQYYNQLSQKLKIPILNMIREVYEFVCLKKYRRVGLLATSTTVERKLYQRFLQHDLLLPPCQEQVTDVVDHILVGKKTQSDKEFLKETVSELRKRGAEAIILGCTELSLLIHQNDVDIPLIDSVGVLARSTVKFATS